MLPPFLGLHGAESGTEREGLSRTSRRDAQMMQRVLTYRLEEVIEVRGKAKPGIRGMKFRENFGC